MQSCSVHEAKMTARHGHSIAIQALEYAVQEPHSPTKLIGIADLKSPNKVAFVHKVCRHGLVMAILIDVVRGFSWNRYLSKVSSPVSSSAGSRALDVVKSCILVDECSRQTSLHPFCLVEERTVKSLGSARIRYLSVALVSIRSRCHCED